MKAKILLIEGKRTDRPSFLVGLTKKGYLVESVPNGSAAEARLAEEVPHAVVIDAASMRTSGKRICQALREQAKGLPIVLILEENSEIPNGVEADVVLVLPFTAQKLINRMRPFLPVKQKDVLQVGPIELDVKQRMLRCLSRQTRLTPRLVMLLKALMDHPGEVLIREELFSKVWDTDYTGDTRTLDVHVSWLRQALEEDPRHPKFLKTIRGVGYRLDVEEAVRPKR